ncbi:hypothetical protein A2U01_0065889, partial [Trifolium medium]|nr:hypothetical protein [Trifolium medium]
QGPFEGVRVLMAAHYGLFSNSCELGSKGDGVSRTRLELCAV